MTADKLTVRLTNDQQKQIQEATGQKVTALNLDLMAADQLSQSALDSVSGGQQVGLGMRKSAGGTVSGSFFLSFLFD
jgi:hypothetical protein